MPRFGISAMGLSSQPFSSPPPVTSPSPRMGMMSSALVPLSSGSDPNSSNNKTSVHLCCASGDGKTIFSLGFQGIDGYFLERRTLPLHNEDNEPKPPQQAKLPQFVQTALGLNPPVEILYVEGDNPKGSKQGERGEDSSIPPSLLCLYSRKNVFYLEMMMDEQGEVLVEASVAYDQYFLNADEALTVVRIRPAPQRRADYASFCPRGAMAMLTHNPYSNEHALVLQHSQEMDLVSVPLNFYLEESSEQTEGISDFCFALSDGLPLFSTMSVLLLKGSGDVHAASPVLFDGSVIHKSALMEAMDFVDYQLESLEHDKSNPKYKQCRAAKQYLHDAFGGDSDSQGNFLTANIFSQAQVHSAVTWPVKIQGPVLSPNNPGGGCAVAIENFSSSELIGVAIGRDGHAVDLGIVSPSCLLPRFRFETDEDGYAIDDNLIKSGAVVQRLLLSEEEATAIPMASTNQSLALIRDPVIDSMLHYVTAKGVTTVNTTAMRLALRKLQGKPTLGASNKSSTVRNSAWASVNVSSGSVEGAVIGTDPRYGHGMFVKLSGGSLMPVNVTESRYRHELEHLINPDADQSGQKVAPSHSVSDAALQRMEDLTPFHEVIEPLLKKVSTGLAGLGKLVGSETKSKDITPDQLAVALKVKERCDKELVLPLLELKRTVLARREILKNMFKDEKKQISEQKKALMGMQDRMDGLKQKAAAAQENAVNLAKRGDAAFQASQDLRPSITQAEFAFFEYLKRQKVKMEDVDSSVKQVIEQTKEVQGRIKTGEMNVKFEFNSDSVKHADQLQQGEEKIMAYVESTLKASEQLTNKVASQSGVTIHSAQQ